jgi:hypothetical protein
MALRLNYGETPFRLFASVAVEQSAARERLLNWFTAMNVLIAAATTGKTHHRGCFSWVSWSDFLQKYPKPVTTPDSPI